MPVTLLAWSAAGVLVVGAVLAFRAAREERADRRRALLARGAVPAFLVGAALLLVAALA